MLHTPPLGPRELKTADYVPVAAEVIRASFPRLGAGWRRGDHVHGTISVRRDAIRPLSWGKSEISLIP